MNILFRADGNTSIGYGHIMRCYALAEALVEQGGTAMFVMEEEQPHFTKRLAAAGISLHVLDCPAISNEDIAATLQQSAKLDCDWIVVDGYQFTPEYQEELQVQGKKVLYVDDHGHADRYVADIVFNQNISATEDYYKGKTSTSSKLILGSSYVLMRKEFRSIEQTAREIPEIATKILITLGGGDPDNATRKVVEALQPIAREDLHITVVIGGSNPHRASIEQAAEEIAGEVEIIQQAENMADLMSQADIAITAGGSTNWETLYLGLPTITGIIALNQENIVKGLHEAQGAIGLGWYNQIPHTDITKAVQALLDSREMRALLSRNGQKIIDGNGVNRVLEALH